MFYRLHIPAAAYRNQTGFLFIPIHKNLSVFLSGKTSVSSLRDPYFTRQTQRQV